MARLDRMLERAAAERVPQVALVAGEAGVGKTRLIHELGTKRGAGVEWLAAQAEPDGVGRPYELLLAAVESRVSGWVRVPPELEGHVDTVGRLLHPVNARLSCADRAYGQQELVSAGVAVVRHLLADQPGLIAFEDLHWADAESIAMFVRLAVAPGLPALVVGTYRHEGISSGHPVAGLGADLERRCSVAHIGLDRLSHADVAALLESVYDRAVSYRAVDAVHSRTGGNPLFLEELLLAAGDAEPEALADLALPGSVAEAVLAQVDSLEPAEQAVMRAAAVLGQRVDFDVLAAVTGLGEGDLIAALRGPVERGLLVEADVDRFAFRHAVTREAVAGTLFGRERRRLHEKALAAMQEAGSDDFATLAHHAHSSGRLGEMVDLARQGAATYLRQGSAAEALRLAETGLSHDPDDLELLTVATRSARALGVVDVAIAHARRWQTTAALRGDVQSELAALYQLARIRWVAADSAGHADAVRAALALAQEEDTPAGRAVAFAMAAEKALLDDRGDEAIDYAARALAIETDDATETARLSALVSMGAALTTVPGRDAEGIALLESALADAERAADTFAQQRAYANLVVTQLWHWPAQRTTQMVRQCRRLAEQTGDFHVWPIVSSVVGSQLAWIAGDASAARRVLDDVRAERLTPHPGPAHWREVLFDALLAIESDDTDAATETLRTFDQSSSAGGSRWPSIAGPWRHAVAAQVAARTSDLPAALAHLRSAATATHEEGADRILSAGAPAGRGWVLDALVVALRAGLSAADGRAVLSALEDGDRPVRAWPHPRNELHADAALLEAEGQIAEADARYAAALACPGNREACWLADAHLGRARCLHALGRDADSVPECAEAIRLLRHWPGWRHAAAWSLGQGLEPAGTPAAVDDEPTVELPDPAGIAAPLAPRRIVEFRVLGDVAIVVDGTPVVVGSGLQRRLLAVLLASGGPVGMDRLAEVLWDGVPPDSAMNSLQSHISRLRRLVGAERLVSGPAGYTLVVLDDDLDTTRFDRGIDAARAALAEGRCASAVRLFEGALGLWRGPAFAEFADAEFARSRSVQLEQLRLAAVEDLIDCRLVLGQHAQVLGELQRLTLDHPLRERLWAQRMLALYRSGRQSDALRAFADLRRVLADELGISPGSDVTRLEAAILAQDPALGLAPNP
jgi:DNA-binding SARP family transcriptional activator